MLEHLAWVAREMSMHDGEEADPWAVGGGGAAAALDALRAYRWVTIVDEVILTLTVLGSIAILGSMFLLEFNGRPATTRMRIVQSLVLSDLILGLVGMIGTSIVLGGTPLANGSPTCSGLGFCLVVVLWTEHLWTLILAIATYMILIYPLHPATLWLERRWYYLWILVWVLATVVGLIGYMLFGFYPNGGICYYGPNSGLYGELIQFVPRAVVMLMISILYARLFVFLRRPDRIRASFSDNSNHETYERTPPQSRCASRHLFRSTALSGMLARGRKGSKETDGSGQGPLAEKGAPAEAPSQSTHHKEKSRSRSGSRTEDGLPTRSGANTPGAPRLSTPPSTPDEPAPWEQVQLPIFHIDGERFGGREAGGPAGLHRETSSIWSGWKGMGKADKERGPRRPRPSTASSTSPPTIARSRFSNSSSPSADFPASPKSNNAISVFPPTAEMDLDSPASETGNDPDKTPTQARYNAGDVWQGDYGRHGSVSSSLTGRVERFRKPSAISAFSYHVTEEPESPASRSNSRSRGSRRGSALAEKATHDNPLLTPDTISEQGETQGFPFDRPTNGVQAQSPGRKDGGEMEELNEEEQGEDAWDLMRMLQASAPSGDAARTQQEGEQAELVEESMASYLNRKTALLMLWFPLGYVLLFSVSLIRIIYDFVGQPPIELRALSRWFIFSQGVLDALIYGLVEWHTKRVVRKRVRKGTFNTPAASRGTASGIGGAMRAMGQGSRNLFPSRSGSQQAGVNMMTSGGSISAADRHAGRLNGNGQTRSSNWTPTTSYIPPIPEGHSIEQELEDEGMYEKTEGRAESGTGTGSGYELEEDSTRKGSGGSDVGKESDVVLSSIEDDGRGRERRKDS